MNKEFFSRLVLDRTPLDKVGHNPYYLSLESGLDDPLYVEGKEFINLAANNYLGLASDHRVKEAVKSAVDKYGASLCGTPIATGYLELYKKLEARLANFVGLEDAIILPSCYQANNGIFCATASKKDVVIVDHYAHSSLIEGIRAVGCKVRPFLHNDLKSLEKNLITAKGYRSVFVVTESVFSTEGSIAPFGEMVELCKKYDAIPVIDDSHGIGVIGHKGSGILSHCNIPDYHGIYTTSLGKALANSGGIIAGKKPLIEYLRYYCSHLIYSTALTPPTLAGIDAVLSIIEADFEMLSKTMRQYQGLIRGATESSGFRVSDGQAPITSIIGGSTEETITLARRFYEHGVLTTPFVYPSVPQNEGKVRLIAGANLSDRSISKATDIIRHLGEST